MNDYSNDMLYRIDLNPDDFDKWGDRDTDGNYIFEVPRESGIFDLLDKHEISKKTLAQQFGGCNSSYYLYSTWFPISLVYRGWDILTIEKEPYWLLSNASWCENRQGFFWKEEDLYED